MRLLGQSPQQVATSTTPGARLNAGEVELLDIPELQEQLLTLVVRGGRIDHQAGDHDDFSNAAAGATWLASDAKRPPDRRSTLVVTTQRADPVMALSAMRKTRLASARRSRPRRAMPASIFLTAGENGLPRGFFLSPSILLFRMLFSAK